MIYPVDVQKSSAEAGKVIGQEKWKIFTALFIVANLGIPIFTLPFFESVGIHWIVPIVIQVALTTFILTFIIRIFVLKEDEKLNEQTGAQSDSFARYCFLRNLTVEDTIDVGGVLQVPLFEFVNGTNQFVMRFRFGANDDQRALNTRRAIEKIIRILGRYGLEFSQSTAQEDFKDSPEARAAIEALRKVEDTNQAKYLMDIAQHVFQYASDASSVSIFRLEVKTRSNYQKYELSRVIAEILRVVNETRTAFRSVDFLNSTEFVEYMREHYGLEVIDLSLISTRELVEEDLDNRDLVKIYRIVGANGLVIDARNDPIAETMRVGTKVN